MTNGLSLANTADPGQVPENVRWSFYIGAFFFLSAVCYTVFTTREYPPAPDDGSAGKQEGMGLAAGIREFTSALRQMPPRMKAVSLVQFFTWPGLFLMWFYYTTAVAVNVFHGTDASDPVYAEGADFGSLTLSFYSVVTFLFSMVLPAIADRLGRKVTHAICLMVGAMGLYSVNFIREPDLLFVSMACVGIAWASILSMPYAMLSGVLPRDRVGIYMGIFNFFIVLPEIIASLGFGWLMRNVLDNDRLAALTLGSVLMGVAAILCLLLVREKNTR
jgi:maltose/moltooligosaccharide transporter